MRRPLRKIGIALGALLLLLVLTIAGALLYLRSAAGGELLRAQLLEAVNGAIPGKLEAGRAVLWGETVILEDVKLYTPEGELVASVRRVEAVLDLPALAGLKVLIRDAQVDGLQVFFHVDERGLGLARAVVPKDIAALKEKRADDGGGLTIDVQKLTVRDSLVEYKDKDRQVQLQKVGITGGAKIRTGPFDIGGDLKLESRLSGPVEDAFTLSVHAASPERGAWTADAKGGGGGLWLDLGFDPRATRLTLRQLSVKESLGLAFLPDAWPPVDAEVKGTLEANKADLSLALSDGGGAAKVSANWDVAGDKRALGAAISFEAVNLAKLKKGLPNTRIGGTLSGSFADFRPATLTGKVEVKSAYLDEHGDPVADLEAKLDADHGVVKLEPVALVLPGAKVEVKGTASEAKLNLTGRLRAEDAGLSFRTLAHATGLELPAIFANGVLDVKIEGPVANPSVLLKGKLASVGVGELRGSGVELSGAIPSVRRWREVDARLAVARLEVGDTAFESVRLGLETRGRDVTLDVSSKGLTALLVRAAGRLEGDNALALGSVSVEYPGTTWATQTGSRLSWERGIDLLPLELRSGAQSLVLELHKPPGRLSAKATATNLDVSRLPTAFVPQKLGLAGSLSGVVTAEGTTGTPKVSATVEVKGGKVRTLAGIDAHAEAALDQGRGAGTLRATVKNAAVEGTFDFPLKLGKAPPDTPLNLAVQLNELPFSELFALAGQTEPPVVGTLRVGATLQGTIREPRLSLDASTLGAVIAQQPGRSEVPIHSASVMVQTSPEGVPIVDVEVNTLGGTLKVNATTSKKLESLLWQPPDAKSARAMDWTATATLDGLALAAVRPLIPETLVDYDGTVKLDARALGPIDAPALQAHLTLSDLTGPDFKPILVTANFDGGPSKLELDATAEYQGKTLLRVRGKSDLSFTELMTNSIDPSKSLGLTAQVGPMDLAQLAAVRGDEQSAMTGLVHASLDASGTLGAPKASLRAELEKLKLQKTALGKALVEWNYDASQNAVQVWAQSTNGGQLQAKASVSLDLGLPALKRKTFSVLEAPVKASFAARGFELSFLSGAHAALRTVGGYLTADAAVDGKLGAPALEGKVTWNKGRLGIAGMSELKDIELAVIGDNDTVLLERLDLKSGAGTASLKGEARRGGGGAQWAFTGNLQAERLPVVTDDQLRVILDVRAALEGDLSPLLWNVRRVEIPEAHVQLPVVKKKNTQSLDRPDDIVLVRNGVALGPRPRRWKKKADAALAAAKERQKSRVIRVVLQAPRNLWVKGTDVNLELGLSDDFTLEFDQQLYLNGEVKVMGDGTTSRSKVEVMGRKFILQPDSTVRFQGPANAPALNVTAAYTNEREKVTVYATLVGQGDDFTFRTSSKPALSDTEIYTLLATGRRQLRSGSGGSALSAEQGLSVLGSLVASQLKSALTEKMPIELFDVLEISAGGEGFKGARLEAGKYIGDRLYIGYVGQVGADPRKGENGNAGRIEYQFAPGWSVQGTAGDAPAGSAEIVWGIEF